MQFVDRLERPYHHLELGDEARVVPADDVHAVDDDAFNRALEFKHG